MLVFLEKHLESAAVVSVSVVLILYVTVLLLLHYWEQLEPRACSALFSRKFLSVRELEETMKTIYVWRLSSISALLPTRLTSHKRLAGLDQSTVILPHGFVSAAPFSDVEGLLPVNF